MLHNREQQLFDVITSSPYTRMVVLQIEDPSIKSDLHEQLVSTFDCSFFVHVAYYVTVIRNHFEY